jgi:hypothetical protein
MQESREESVVWRVSDGEMDGSKSRLQRKKGSLAPRFCFLVMVLVVGLALVHGYTREGERKRDSVRKKFC